MRAIFLLLCFFTTYLGIGQVFKISNSTVTFISVAPLETIKAENKNLVGALDMSTKKFIFRINMKDFKGFNSPLQQEHFFENYIEANKFPYATFTGKMLDDISKFEKNKTYRAKGNLYIHGVSKEIIIDVEFIKLKDRLNYETKFEIILNEFNILIPKIVSQKISKTLVINAKGSLINS